MADDLAIYRSRIKGVPTVPKEQEPSFKPSEGLIRAASEFRAPKVDARPVRIPTDTDRQRATQLQRAYKSRLQRSQANGQTASSSLNFGGTSPITSSVAKAKALVRAAMLGNRDLGDIKDQVEDVQNDPNIGVNEFQELLKHVVAQQQNEPARVIPGGSVTISRGNGPNAISEEQLRAGQARNQAGLQAGEQLTPSAEGYNIKLPDRTQGPLAGGKAPPKQEESAYQKENIESMKTRISQAEQQERFDREQAAKEDENEAGSSAKDTDLQGRLVRDQQTQEQLQKRVQEQLGTLPGAPEQQAAPAPVAAPAPQNIGTVTPTGGQPRQFMQGGPVGNGQAPPVAAPVAKVPTHPTTNLPIAATQEDYASLPAGALYHGPAGQLRRKLPPQQNNPNIPGGGVLPPPL